MHFCINRPLYIVAKIIKKMLKILDFFKICIKIYG